MSAGRFTTFLRIIAGWRDAYPAYKSHIHLAIQNNHTEVWLELNVPLLLGTGGCGGCSSGIRTIAATGRRRGDPHCRTYGAHAGCGGTSCRNRRGSRPCCLTHLNGGGIDRSRRKRRYSPQAIQNFFITNSLHCMNGDLPKRISGEIEYTQAKVCKLRHAGI